MKKGPSKTSPDVATAYIAPEMVYEIAKLKKMDEFSANMSLEAMCHCVMGTCRTMGIKVKEVEETSMDDAEKDNMLKTTALPN